MRFLILTLLLTACSSPSECKGAGDAGLSGATATDDTTVYTYGNFTWSANNDCPAPGSKVVSITVDGVQTDPATGTPFHWSFCIPRPDLVGKSPVPIDGTSIVDFAFSGSQGTCTIQSADPDPSTTAAVSFAGFCPGTKGSAFAMSFSGSIAGSHTCASVMQNVTFGLGGTVTAWAE